MADSQRLRRGVVVAQVALTLMLLSAGGLVARSFVRLLAVDPGFTPGGVLTFRVAMDPRLFPKREDGFAFQDRVETALRALTGVKSVGATAALPLSVSAPQNSIWGWQEMVTIPSAPGNTGDAQRDSVVVQVIAARTGYAESMGMRIVAGRAFERAGAGTVQEAVIDEQLAQRFFPTGTPIGAAIPFRVSGSVVRRHGELAVRLALGASHQRTLRLVLGEGALLVFIGMVIAIPGVYAAGGLVRGLLIGVSPWDPWTLAAVAAGLLLVTMAACYVPARRVLRIDPAPLLRQD